MLQRINRASLLILCLLVLAAPRATAQDVVKLSDGSIILGEIKKLEFAKLTVDTDDFDLIHIDWDPIVYAKGVGPFNVHLESGEILSGAIELDTLNLTITGITTWTVPRGSISEIKDFDQGFMNQLSAGVNVGADFVRGNNRVASINAGANLGWANNKTEATFKVNTILNEQTDAPDTRRFTSSLGIDHSLGGRPRAGVSLSYESDENQQLDYRTVSTVSVGYRIIQEQRTRLDLSVGSGPTAEKFTGSESEVIGEGRTGFSLIARPNGDTKVDLSAFLFPSLFDFDRLRVEADLTFAVEIIADLDFNVSSFYRFNSEPPVDVDKNDYGVNFGIAWSY